VQLNSCKIVNNVTCSLLVEELYMVYFWSFNLNAACGVVWTVNVLLAEIVLAMNNLDDAEF
jgi:hypothetical protein